MIAVAETIREAPSVPVRRPGPRARTEAAGRIAGFVFELDLLFDAARYETAAARALARSLAAHAGLDPLWLEVLAVEATRRDGGAEARRTIAAAAGGPDAERLEIPREAYDAVVPRDGAHEVLAAIRRQFKLAVVSDRPRGETMRILRALDLVEAFDAGAFAADPDASSSTPGDPVCARACRLLDEPASSCVLVGRVGSSLLGAAETSGMSAVAIAPAAAAADADTGFGILPGEGAGLVLGDLALVELLAEGAAAR